MDTVMNQEPITQPMPASRSAEIDKLAVALAKAQGAMEAAKRGAENPGFKREGKNSKYADLSSVWEAIRDPLTTNGLSIVQLPTTLQSGVEIETLMFHESGQFLRNVLWMPCGQTMTVHTIGSAITYGRRYALMAIAGVAPEEDDGNSAAGVGEHKPGAPGTAGGGRDFRPAGPRRMPLDVHGHPHKAAAKEMAQGPTNDWVGDAERDGIVDETRPKGTLPAAAATAKAKDAVKLAERAKKAITYLKDNATTNEAAKAYWTEREDAIGEIEAAMPQEYARMLDAYNECLDRTSARAV